MDELNPLTAVTAADPHPYYARLVAERPFYYDETVRAWIASSAAAVDAVLDDPTFCVRPASEPVPEAMNGTALGDIFGRLVRMNDGSRHDELKARVAELLARWLPDRAYATALACAQAFAAAIGQGDGLGLDEYLFDVPASATASIAGLEHSAASRSLIRDFARAIAPSAGTDVIARGVSAAQALSRLVSEGDADGTANLLGFLFQSYDATAALIGSVLAGNDWGEPPVHNTRRFAAAGTTIARHAIRPGDCVLVLLAAAHRDPRATRSYAFGTGRHACPGQAIALAVARAAVDALRNGNVALDAFEVVGYRPSLNTRIPRFGARARVA